MVWQKNKGDDKTGDDEKITANTVRVASIRGCDILYDFFTK